MAAAFLLLCFCSDSGVWGVTWASQQVCNLLFFCYITAPAEFQKEGSDCLLSHRINSMSTQEADSATEEEEEELGEDQNPRKRKLQEGSEGDAQSGSKVWTAVLHPHSTTCASSMHRNIPLCALVVRAYTRTCMRTRTHMPTYGHAHALSHTRTRTYTHTHTHTSACTYTHAHTNSHTHTQTRTRTHTYTYICSNADKCSLFA